MSSRTERKVRSVAPGSGVGYSREFLERIARILVLSGHSPTALIEEFREVCSPLKEPRESWDPKQLAYLADLPHVVAHWHADPDYLDAKGEPLAVPLQGRGRSLYALIRRVLPNEEPAAVAHSLQLFRGICRRGRLYRPTGRHLSYQLERSSARAHGLWALLGMLRTVEHNIARPDDSTLLERAAMNPRFPISALPAFHRRLKVLAEEFLWIIDSDMRRREVTHGAGPTTRLSVEVFACEDPIRTDAKRIRGVRPGLTRRRPRRTR